MWGVPKGSFGQVKLRTRKFEKIIWWISLKGSKAKSQTGQSIYWRSVQRKRSDGSQRGAPGCNRKNLFGWRAFEAKGRDQLGRPALYTILQKTKGVSKSSKTFRWCILNYFKR